MRILSRPGNLPGQEIMLFSTFLLLAAAPQEPVPSDLRIVDLKTHIGFLSSEELEGREAGRTTACRLAVP